MNATQDPMNDTATLTFQEIVNGKGEFLTYASISRRFKKKAGYITCADGTTLSVQASSMHYCRPRADLGPYTHVEVGFPSVDPPETWAVYADGKYPSDVYGYIPVALVREFIDAHGGEVIAK